jgi:hypothetical protein
MLPFSQKGRPGQDIRIPQGQLPLGQALTDKLPPVVILQNQVADEAVVRDGGISRGRVGLSGGPLVQIIQGEHRLAAHRHRPIQEQGKQPQSQNKEEITLKLRHEA